MWWAAGTLATQAEQMPRHWFARVLAILWMFVGVVFVAYYTAQLPGRSSGPLMAPRICCTVSEAVMSGASLPSLTELSKGIFERIDGDCN